MTFDAALGRRRAVEQLIVLGNEPHETRQKRSPAAVEPEPRVERTTSLTPMASLELRNAFGDDGRRRVQLTRRGGEAPSRATRMNELMFCRLLMAARVPQPLNAPLR